MLHATHRDHEAPIIIAIVLFVSALICGQLLDGSVAMAIALAGMAWRQQPAHRKAGNGLIVAGLVFVLVGMLFGTGCRLGKNMADRDNARATASFDASAH